jgi:hypothetical protein
MEATTMSDRDRVHPPESGNPFGTGEPARDALLGPLLRDIVGTPPAGQVDWTALARRIATATATPLPSPWWSYAARWERRALPLALAAGLAGAVALWGLGTPSQSSGAWNGSADLVTAVVSGAPADDAARSFARSITADPSIEVPE